MTVERAMAQPSRLRSAALIALVMLLGVHAALLAAVYQRVSSQRALNRQVQSLSANVESLQTVLVDREQELEQDLERVQSELAQLQSNVPGLHQPHELANSILNLAPLDSIQVTSLIRVGLNELTTATGPVTVHTFRIAGQGSMAGCLRLIERLETSGDPTLATENIRIEPGTELCEFDVLIMSPASASSGTR